LPLCLFSRDMQYRLTPNGIYKAVDATPNVVLETNAMDVLLAVTYGKALCSRKGSQGYASRGQFKPGELGLHPFRERLGHELIVTGDMDGPNAEFDKHPPDADGVISQPFSPAYLTKERIATAKKQKLAVTAGVGSDHVDLEAAARAHITVAEVTGSNAISVAEHVAMMVLSSIRNDRPAHAIAVKGGWNIADCVARSYGVEGMHFGAIAAGRIGLAVLRRLKSFYLHRHYTDPHRQSPEMRRS
jgi:formate dehydrogenase